MALRKAVKRMLYFGLPGLVVLALVVVSLTRGNGDNTMVQADLAFVADISETVSATGRIQPQTKVNITAEVSAEIIGVLVAEGDAVKKGQRLLVLDTVQYQSDVQQAQFSLDETVARTEAARTSYERDRLEFDRQQRLYEQQLTSETDYTDARFAQENSKANHEAMQAQVRTARARLEQAQDNLTKTGITAPMDGVITYLSAEAGEIAQAQTAFTQGLTLMTVADLSVFEVEVEVDESEISKVTVGQSAEIKIDAYRDTVFAGTVIEIGNSAIVRNEGTDDYSTNFRVKLRLVESGVSIRPGMSATVDITTATASDALLIPYASVVTREIEEDSAATEVAEQPAGSLVASTANAAEAQVTSAAGIEEGQAAGKGEDEDKRTGVFIVKRGLAEFVDVITGIADDRNIVALSGVNPGDTVVSGSFQTLRSLKNGDAVAIEESSVTKMTEKNH